MGIGICPTVDFAFKLMLGSPEHTNITVHFLNSVLEDQPRITHVQILNPFLEKERNDDKLSVLDILATDEHNRLLNIEMQTSLPAELPQRLVYYASCLYAGQMTEGSGYLELRPAITICVLTKAMFPQIPGVHVDFRLREKSGVMLTDNLQIHFLELSKLQVTAQNVYNASPAERWAWFLKHAEYLTRPEIDRLFPDREIAEAAGVLEMISKTVEQQLLYNARLKFQRDEESRLRHARNEAIQEGRREGREEGRQLGLEEGRQEGLEEGRQEGLEEGRQEGLEEGILVGRILLLQQFLGLPQVTVDELTKLDESHLIQLEADLQRQLSDRR